MALKASRWWNALAHEQRALADLLWPPACWVCRCAAADGVACADHALRDLERELASGSSSRAHFTARCGLCSRRLPPGTKPRAPVAPPWLPSGVSGLDASWRRCRACRLKAPGFGRLLALDDYPGDLRPWVLALKHGRGDLALPLARLLRERLEVAGWLEPTSVRPVLVPVPRHPLRRLERGGNAPDLLACALSIEIGWPVVRLLRRRRLTAAQGEPGARSRSANVAGVFGLSLGGWLRFALRGKPPRHMAAVLVDDVGSSGATLSECARLLRKRGATSVGAVTLARSQWAR